MIQFDFCLVKEWPPLAWAAQCSKTNSIITVYHGSRVEVRNAWFCEAIWDDEYEAGGFDTTDIVFGSGGRIRDGQATFVSSGSTVDRLQTLTYAKGVWVSNSLACLMSVSGADLDPTNSYYSEQVGSIVKGLSKYKKFIDVSVGKLNLVYFNNVKWNGNSLVEVDKPNEERDFSSFEKYHEFLLSALSRISGNMSAKGRINPFQMLGTLSSGYDSTTITVMAHKVGLREAISLSKARSGDADDGKEIADVLGIQLTLVPRNNWKSTPFVEATFIAADAMGEAVYFASAERLLPGTVLLTGFHGDKVWAKETYELDPNIVRGDRSGLSLSEYRILKGFIHLPVPFMGVRQIGDINKISNSEEMKPWDVPGDYSRPICRRIVEGAGIQRNQFGMSKKAASVLFGLRGDVFSPVTRQALYQWLSFNSKLWSSQGKVPAHKLIKLIEKFHTPLRLLKLGLGAISRITPSQFKSPIIGLTKRLDNLETDRLLLKHAFPWAIEKAKERYNAYHKISKKSKIEV